MEHRKKRIAFLGLGGVGGYFGAKMAREYADAEGVEIIFLAREKTAEIIRRNGIKLSTPTEEFVAHPRAVYTSQDELSPVDILICAVKSYDLEQSLESFRGCINEHTAILPLLNGVDAEERIRSMFPANDVWSGCVYIVSRITAPGVITETGNIHQLHFGNQSAATQPGSLQSRDKCEAFCRILKSCHEDVFLHENIRDVVWEKFIFISTIASLTSYLDVCIGKIPEHAGNRRKLESLLSEICAVARAEKIKLPVDIIPATLAKMSRLPYETTSSMHSDFRRGGRTEYHSLTVHVVKLAEQHGIKVPVYRQVLSGLEIRSTSAAT